MMVRVFTNGPGDLGSIDFVLHPAHGEVLVNTYIYIYIYRSFPKNVIHETQVESCCFLFCS